MHCTLATLATLVAALIAQNRALGAPSPTDSNSPKNPQPPLDDEVSNTAPYPPFSAFPNYCPKIITSSIFKKGRATLDYTGLRKKKLDLKDGTVEKVADWLSVRLAYARMGHNYVDPTLEDSTPAIAIWIMPMNGIPLVDPMAHYKVGNGNWPENVNQVAYVNSVAERYKKPVYIMLNRNILQQPAGEALVSIFRNCYGATVAGNLVSTTSAKEKSDRPVVGPNTSPPQDDDGYSITAQYDSQSRHGDTTMNNLPTDGRFSMFEMPAPNQPFVALRSAGVGEFAAPQDTSTAPPNVDPYHWNPPPNFQNSAPTAEKQQDSGDPISLLQSGNYPSGGNNFLPGFPAPDQYINDGNPADKPQDQQFIPPPHHPYVDRSVLPTGPPTTLSSNQRSAASDNNREKQQVEEPNERSDLIDFTSLPGSPPKTPAKPRQESYSQNDAFTTHLTASPAGEDESTEDASSVASSVDSGFNKKIDWRDFIEYPVYYEDEEDEQAREPLNDSEPMTESTRPSAVKPEPSNTTIPPPDVDKTDDLSEHRELLASSKEFLALDERAPVNIEGYRSELNTATDWKDDTDHEDEPRQDAKGVQLSKKFKME
ncbi:hypothetical protein IWQ60_011739 [Tieghemiomyces parasiticus]|uniref:Uncharacterized protein n=1 Tax=Tieghemiomyces parasiticus TaxID=78921 RepID=A0A9W8DI64_9FUNG|nr:hypothetical protein IWQ60_011739 [Tieghemiomyces parasiticus]